MLDHDYSLEPGIGAPGEGLDKLLCRRIERAKQGSALERSMRRVHKAAAHDAAAQETGSVDEDEQADQPQAWDGPADCPGDRWAQDPVDGQQQELQDDDSGRRRKEEQNTDDDGLPHVPGYMGYLPPPRGLVVG